MNRRAHSPAVAAKRRRVAAILVLMLAAAVTAQISSTGGPANGLHFAACVALAGATAALIHQFKDLL